MERVFCVQEGQYRGIRTDSPAVRVKLVHTLLHQEFHVQVARLDHIPVPAANIAPRAHREKQTVEGGLHIPPVGIALLDSLVLPHHTPTQVQYVLRVDLGQHPIPGELAVLV